MKSKKIFFIIFLFLGLFAIRFYLSTFFFNHDIINHLWWVNSLKAKGFLDFYDRNFYPKAPANYPPLVNFLFYYADRAYHLIFGQFDNLNLLASFYKLPSLLPETALLVWFLLKKSYFGAAVLFFNPAIFYNTLFWGQTEGAISSLVFFSFLALCGRKKLLGFLLFTSAILVKQTAFVFLPVFALMAFQKTSLKQKILGLFLSLFLIWFSFSFFTDKNYFSFPFAFYLETLGGQKHQYQASVNAFNFWYLFNFNNVSDQLKFLGFSLRFWGIFLTGVFSLPLLAKLVLPRPRLAGTDKFGFSRFLMAAGLLSFCVCLFMTRIHERYFFPVLIFLLPLAIKSVFNFALYFILSLTHFLNLYWVWHYPSLPFFDFLLAPEFIRILIVVNLGIFFYFFTKFFITKKFNENNFGKIKK